jgi:cAMP phosphodiesterase
VKVRILPSSPDADHLQHLISFVIDGRLAVDAGSVGLCGLPESQAAITHLILTHSHADHVCSLPFFAMNVCDTTGRGVTVHAPAPVLNSLRQDVFNWRFWPDFTALKQNGWPMVTLEPLEVRRPVRLGDFEVTAIPVNHPVPTVSYLIDDGTAAVLIAVDTAATEEVWDVAARHPRLRAAFVDAAFPDDMSEMAAISGHLTPRVLSQQVTRLPESVPRIAVHLKPAFHDRVAADLERAAIPNLTIGRIGSDYEI